MSLNTVPADILLEIADYLSCPSEVFNLYLTVRPFYSIHTGNPLKYKKNPYRPQESQMRSPRRSTRALSCAARRSALIRSTCSTHTPRARATFACSVSPRTTRLCTHPRPRVRELDDGCRPDGAAACYRTGMWCRRLCGARRVTSRSCARLCGMARSCRRMMTCGSHCVFRASLF